MPGAVDAGCRRSREDVAHPDGFDPAHSVARFARPDPLH
jgi:hypothetical protein